MVMSPMHTQIIRPSPGGEYFINLSEHGKSLHLHAGSAGALDLYSSFINL